MQTPYCSWKKMEKWKIWEYEKYEKYGHDETWKKLYMKRGHVWEYFQTLHKKHDLLLAVVQCMFYVQVSFNEIESLLRSSIKPKCDNYLCTYWFTHFVFSSNWICNHFTKHIKSSDVQLSHFGLLLYLKTTCNLFSLFIQPRFIRVKYMARN